MGKEGQIPRLYEKRTFALPFNYWQKRTCNLYFTPARNLRAYIHGEILYRLILARALKPEHAQKGVISVLFGFSSKVGDSLTFSSAPKINTKFRIFMGRRILRRRIFLCARQKRSESFRIHEYFNNATAENSPLKIGFGFQCSG